MRKKLASKCLCIALAAAMVLGVSAPAYAAQTEESTQVATVAEASPLEVTSSNFYGGDSYISVSAYGYGYDAYLYINDVQADSESNSSYYYNPSWSLYCGVDGRAGAAYTAKVVVYNSDHSKSVTKNLGTKKISGISIDTANAEVSVLSDASTAKGSTKPSAVKVYVPFTQYCYSRFSYEILRSTSKNGKYTSIYSGSDYYSGSISYEDSSITAGKTYYYKVKIYSGTDEYVKTNKLLATSKTMSVNTGKPSMSSTYLSVYSYEMDEETGKVTKSKAGIYMSMYSDFANQYDIYRSTNSKKGFKKIKTVYVGYYMDTNIKAGRTYYYYVVPKYYSNSTKKTTKGKKSDIVAAKYLMDDAWTPELTQVSKNSLRVEWGGVNQPKVSGVSYELWYRRTDIAGDAFKKAGNVTGKKFTLKKLASDGTYEVKIRAVKKSGSKIKYETYSSTVSKTLGYTEYVSNVEVKAKSSSVSSDKKTLNLNYKITWDRVWGASGYKITAYNNYTEKTDTITIKSGKKTSYTLKNKSNTTDGIKYSDISIAPYKGKSTGSYYNSYEVYNLPESKRVKVKQSGTSTKVTWSAVKGASYYTIYRKTALNAFSSQYIGESKTTSFVDKNVDPGMEYTYIVYAGSSFGGVYSSSVTSDAYTHKLPRTKIVKAANSAKKTAKLTWNKVAGANYYLVYRSTSKKGKYKVAGKTSKNTFVNKKLKKGKTYYYKVVAVTKNEGGQVVKSSYSNLKAVKIKK